MKLLNNLIDKFRSGSTSGGKEKSKPVEAGTESSLAPEEYFSETRVKMEIEPALRRISNIEVKDIHAEKQGRASVLVVEFERGGRNYSAFAKVQKAKKSADGLQYELEVEIQNSKGKTIYKKPPTIRDLMGVQTALVYAFHEAFVGMPVL